MSVRKKRKSKQISVDSTICGSASNYIITTTSTSSSWLNYNYTSNTTAPTSLDIQGNANFSGDIKWKGRSLGDTLSAIERRLAILVPDPAKLEHFESLRKAYAQYKLLESLCEVDKNAKP